MYRQVGFYRGIGLCIRCITYAGLLRMPLTLLIQSLEVIDDPQTLSRHLGIDGLVAIARVKLFSPALYTHYAAAAEAV